METRPTVMVPELSGMSSPLRGLSPQRRSILSRNQSFGRELGGEKGMALSRLASGGKSSPNLNACANESRNNRYTSLSELVVTIPTSVYMRPESFSPSSPRTPMRDALVEKAVRAYLQPSESFQARHRRSRWGLCIFSNNFFSSCMSKFSSVIPNPLQFFCCALHCITLYFSRQGLLSSWSWDRRW